ncbi:hypothetical protein MZM54_07070 [[Brevibacterium] frigoritolerans]|nr:hypothetical protein [Peribacillus frigoritolerans]
MIDIYQGLRDILMNCAVLLVNLHYTREFRGFTREFEQFTREFEQFTPEFAVYS